MIYIREAHPGGEIEQPDTWDKRKEIAGDFIAETGISIPTLIDSIDNKTENDYKSWPDRIYIVGEDGKVIYKGEKGPRGFDPAHIVEVLETSSRTESDGGLPTTWGGLKAPR